MKDSRESFAILRHRLHTFELGKLARFLVSIFERGVRLFLFPFAYLAVTTYALAKGKIYCFAEMDTKHLGGWAFSLDGFLRRTRNDRNGVEYVILSNGRIANPYFYELMKRQIMVIENRFLAYFLSPLTRMKNRYSAMDKLAYLSIEERTLYRALNWFSEQDHTRGKILLEQMGMSAPDAWYVCFFARDDAYNEAKSSGSELDNYKTYYSRRNSDINAQIIAMKFILDRGGWVIRMGNIVNKPVGFSHPKLIDYPFSPYLSDFADIYLSCHCRFFMGSLSGILDLSSIVDKPCGLVNSYMYSYNAELIGRKEMLCIPKLMRFRSTGKLLSVREHQRLFKSAMSGSIIYLDCAMKRNDIVYEDNSEEDILMLTVAMYNRFVSGKDEGGTQWNSIADEDLGRTGIWPIFLERHPELLQ